MCWITKGREIENYISDTLIKESLNQNSDNVFNKYDDIKIFLNTLEEGLEKKFESNKVGFAKKLQEI